MSNFILNIDETILNSYYCYNIITPTLYSNFISNISNNDLYNSLISIFNYIELDQKIINYHFRIVPSFKGKSFKLEFFCEKANTRNGPYDTNIECICCTENPTDKYLFSQNSFKLWLDEKDRPMLIITPIKHLFRITELNEDEIIAFFKLAGLALNINNEIYPFKRIVVNHGTYRNVGHLHMKIEFNVDEWIKYVDLVKIIKHL